MIIYDINAYLSADATMLSLTGKSPLVISPMIGYAEDTAPIILYEYLRKIEDNDLYFINCDVIRYMILDVNIDRAFAIRNRIIALLNHSDAIQSQAISSASSRLLSMNLTRSYDMPPNEVEGYYKISSYFDVMWIPKN